MKNNDDKKGAMVSVLNFFTEIPKYIFNQNEKFRKWGVSNTAPNQLLDFYDSVPEHSAAINFILSNVIEEDIPQLDY